MSESAEARNVRLTILALENVIREATRSVRDLSAVSTHPDADTDLGEAKGYLKGLKFALEQLTLPTYAAAEAARDAIEAMTLRDWVTSFLRNDSGRWSADRISCGGRRGMSAAEVLVVFKAMHAEGLLYVEPLTLVAGELDELSLVRLQVVTQSGA